MSLVRTLRLTRGRDYQAVRSRGRAHPGRLLVFSTLSDGETTAFRAGVIVSRTVGGAVQRNLVKRRLREIIRLHRPELKPDAWYVMIARRGSAEASFAELEKEWRRLARRAGVLSEGTSS